MVEITRRLEFDSGHRVLGHEGKCKYLHGHRYVAEVSVISPDLDKLGRVIDFGVIKRVVGGWIDAKWDHNILLNPMDPLLKAQAHGPVFGEIFQGRAPYIMSSGNPTAENMAKVLMSISSGLLSGEGLKISRIVIWETPSCRAEVCSGE